MVNKKLLIIPLTILVILVFFHYGKTSHKDKEVTCSDCNVILIILDTVRADHLGSYGYPHDTSPTIDRLAEEGVVFINAFSQSSHTLLQTLLMLISHRA